MPSSATFAVTESSASCIKRGDIFLYGFIFFDAISFICPQFLGLFLVMRPCRGFPTKVHAYTEKSLILSTTLSRTAPFVDPPVMVESGDVSPPASPSRLSI